MAPQRRVLITGANGYIGAQTVARFIDAGWAVRGTVRDLNSSTARGLAAHFAAEQVAGTLELIAVPDIKSAGAFDAAARGVQAIAHIASPVTLRSDDVDYVVGTAVEGTLSILESALKATAAAVAGGRGGEGVESFVLMSSVAAVSPRGPGPAVFTEKDWNDHSEAEVRELGSKAPGYAIYAASKTASERALWDWVKEKKPSFAATSLLPCWVGGPQLYLPSSPEGIAGTNQFIWKVFSGQDFPAGPVGYGTYVDVRDVARMTEWAASHPDIAGGERYLVGGGCNVGVPQAAADILREAYPDKRNIIKEGTPGEGYLPGYAIDPQGTYAFSSKAIEATGQAWIPYDKMVLDTAKSFEGFL